MKLRSLFRMFLTHAKTALSSATNKQEYFRRFVLQQRLYSLHPSAVEDYPGCTFNLGFPSVVSVPSVVSLSWRSANTKYLGTISDPLLPISAQYPSHFVEIMQICHSPRSCAPFLKSSWGLKRALSPLRKFNPVLASWLAGTEQEHHRLLLKAEARERENKMKSSLLPLGAMKGPRLFLWISGKQIISFFPSQNHSSRAFLDLLDAYNRCISHFTCHIHLKWHMSEVSQEFQSLVNPFQIQTLFCDVIWLPRAPPYFFSLRYDNTKWSYSGVS
jgi:hypothetical protein